MIHDIVIELDSVSICKDGLERGTRTFGGFRPRNRHDLVRVDESIGVLEKVKIKSQAGTVTEMNPEKFL